LDTRILISYPDISEAAKRALSFYGDYPQKVYDGLMEITDGDAFLVDVFVIAQWLFGELTMFDNTNYSEAIIRELVGQIITIS